MREPAPTIRPSRSGSPASSARNFRARPWGAGVARRPRRTRDAPGERVARIAAAGFVAPRAANRARAWPPPKRPRGTPLTGGMPNPAGPGPTVRSVAGGYLVQGRDNGRVNDADLKVATKRAPSNAERADLLFAFAVAKHAKSNPIVYPRNGPTVRIGAAHLSRLA